MAMRDDEFALASRLERGEVVHYPLCPFDLPQGEDLAFLLQQRLASKAYKNIGFDPHTGKVTGFQSGGVNQAERLHGLFDRFSTTTTAWLKSVLPGYATGWQLDRVSYRPEQEATRKLRRTARNDLLHVDAFPSRPTNGARILRVFANINPTEPRVWITTHPFASLLALYGRAVGLPSAHAPLWGRVKDSLLGIFQSARRKRSAYDSFMIRFHNFLKANDEFQKNCPKQTWNFQPGAGWMCITDTASHAVLRGRYALEHSYFLAPETLALPDEAPAALLRQACGIEVLRRAA